MNTFAGHTRNWSLLPLFLLLVISALGQSPSKARITDPIDESSMYTLVGHISPLTLTAKDQGLAPDSLELGRIILMLKPTRTQKDALGKLLDEQQNPNSANYHAWVTPEQYGERFGVSSADVQRITTWLQQHGFRVEAPSAGRNLIVFSGNHSQLKATFHTELHSYELDGVAYYANTTNPQVPLALKPVVSGFATLNNFPRKAQHTTPMVFRRQGEAWKRTIQSTPQQPSFTTDINGSAYHLVVPYDLASIYNVRPLWDAGIDGSGQTIAIVSESDINPADVDFFRTTFGLPPKRLNIIYYGPNPGLSSNESEADLDVEWSGAVAKNATIDLVVAANTPTSGGIDGAAAYIINNNLASIMSVSYGACEALLGTNGNQYYNSLWEQAASQGIAVVVSSGDSGSDACDQNQAFSLSGLSVNGIASTPFDVAVGGTDFHSTYVDPSLYWNDSNDPATLASVKGYLPEATWNDSCASPDVFAAEVALGVNDGTPEGLCNDSNERQLLTDAGGGGGASECAVSGSACISGYAKPAWQSGVPGIPSDGVRDVPDVALFAANGLWGSFYVFCQSDVVFGGVCNLSSGLQGAGGTSFAAPVFAGMMAMVQQKTASMQGNVNYTLYKLATAQYGGNYADTCNTASVSAGNSCLFYDIEEGGIAVPCYMGSTDCTPAVSSDAFGILPGYSTTAGYDLATGLGSVNAYNLVEGWSTASATFLSSLTTISAATSASATYGVPVSFVVSATAASPGTGVPSGDIGVTTNSTTVDSTSVGDVLLSGGHGTVTATLLPVGTYQLYARYAGNAVFSPSTSSGLTITITRASTNANLSSTRTVVRPGQNISFAVSVTGVTEGELPTGTITFTDATTGTTIGTAKLTDSSPEAALSIALLTVPSSVLQFGSNIISARYSGDETYTPANIPTITVGLSGSFTVTTNPGSVDLPVNGTGSVLVTVAPSGRTILVANAISLSCPATVPAGVVCSFSVPVAGPNGTVTSMLTLGLATPLYKPSQPTAFNERMRPFVRNAGLLIGFTGLGLIFIGKRRLSLLSLLGIVSLGTVLSITACSGGKAGMTAMQPALIATSTRLSVSSLETELGSSTVLTSQVVPGSGGISPTGSVTFSSGTVTLGVGAISGGSASFTGVLPIGTQLITATYGGDKVYSPSTSSPVTVSVAYTGSISIDARDTVGDATTVQLPIKVQ